MLHAGRSLTRTLRETLWLLLVPSLLVRGRRAVALGWFWLGRENGFRGPCFARACLPCRPA